jgi:hypothetical protein
MAVKWTITIEGDLGLSIDDGNKIRVAGGHRKVN